MVINGNIYVSETPHFFQVIMSHALQLGKLEVPIKFVRKYGGMSFAGRESVRLVVPNGDTWTVGVEYSSDKVMLGEGWKEFIEHYSLGEGSFVIFRFEPVESVFAVLIFDNTSIEIKYPPKCVAASATTAHLRRVKIKKETTRSESESEFSDQDTGNDDEYEDKDKEDAQSSIEIKYPPKRPAATTTAHIRRVKFEKETAQSESESLDQDTEKDEYEDENKEDDQSSIEIKYPPKRHAAATTAHPHRVKIKKEATRSESEFEFSDQDTENDDDNDQEDEDETHLQNLRTPVKGKSRNPSFRMRIQPSYLKTKSRVTLSHAFVMKNKLNKRLEVKLRLVGNEKTWQLGIFYRETERRGELSNAGWHNFCRESGIRVNDHCEFELTSRVGNKVFFTVSIIA